VDDDELAERCEESSARKAIFEELLKEALAFLVLITFRLRALLGRFAESYL
jgi:hypothetical protein